jgi:hypothetical protein
MSFRAICTFHPLGESENRRKLPKVRSILSQTDFAIFLSVDSGKQLAPHHQRGCGCIIYSKTIRLSAAQIMGGQPDGL